MIIPQNKKGLSVQEGGHYIFSLMLLALGILIILQFTKIPIWDIIQKNILLCIGLLLVYLIFSVFVDKVLEPPGAYNHRGIFHKKIILLACIIFIPITIKKAITTANNYWLMATAGLCGHISHLFGDSLTSKLR